MPNTKLTKNTVETSSLVGTVQDSAIINGDFEFWQRYKSRKWTFSAMTLIPWTRTSGVVTMTLAEHGFSVGSHIAISASAGGAPNITAASYALTATTENTFSFIEAVANSSGTASVTLAAGHNRNILSTQPRTYTADRFAVVQNSAGALQTSVQRSSSIPTELNQKVNYSMKLIAQAGEAVGAGNFCYVEYPMEGVGFKRLWNQQCIFTFYVKTNVAGSYNLTFKSGDGLLGYTTSYSVDAADTWERKSVLIDFRNLSSSNFNFNSNLGLSILWIINSGSSSNMSATESWVSTTTSEISGSTKNHFSTTNNNISITGVDIRLGNVASEYRPLNFHHNQLFCFRHFEKSYNINVNITSISLDGAQVFYIVNNNAGGSANAITAANPTFATTHFKVRKRESSIAPTITLHSVATGASGFVRSSITPSDLAATVGSPSENGFAVALPGGATEATGAQMIWQWTADREY